MIDKIYNYKRSIKDGYPVYYYCLGRNGDHVDPRVESVAPLPTPKRPLPQQTSI